ncbi:MAG: hypothetical protein V4714_14560 [Bacteroidota bacterium]
MYEKIIQSKDELLQGKDEVIHSKNTQLARLQTLTKELLAEIKRLKGDSR